MAFSLVSPILFHSIFIAIIATVSHTNVTQAWDSNQYQLKFMISLPTTDSDDDKSGSRNCSTWWDVWMKMQARRSRFSTEQNEKIIRIFFYIIYHESITKEDHFVILWWRERIKKLFIQSVSCFVVCYKPICCTVLYLILKFHI